MECRTNIISTRILLSPREFTHIGRSLQSRLTRDYDGVYFHPYGIIEKGSSKLLSHGYGETRDSQLCGSMSFQITFECKIFAPIRGDILLATVSFIAKHEIVCDYFSHQVIISSELSTWDNMVFGIGSVIRCEVVNSRYISEKNKHLITAKILDVIENKSKSIRIGNLSLINNIMPIMNSNPPPSSQYLIDIEPYLNDYNDLINPMSALYQGRTALDVLSLITQEIITIMKTEHNVSIVVDDVSINNVSDPSETITALCDKMVAQRSELKLSETVICDTTNASYSKTIVLLLHGLVCQRPNGVMIVGLPYLDTRRYNELVQFIGFHYNNVIMIRPDIAPCNDICMYVVFTNLIKMADLELVEQLCTLIVGTGDNFENCASLFSTPDNQIITNSYVAMINKLGENVEYVKNLTELRQVKDGHHQFHAICDKRIETHMQVTAEYSKKYSIDRSDTGLQIMGFQLLPHTPTSYMSKEFCLANPRKNSNPRFNSTADNYNTIFFTAGDLDDLVHTILEPDSELTPVRQIYQEPNIDEEISPAIHQSIESMFEWDKWEISQMSTLNTLDYMFRYHKRGVFVKFHGGKLVAFVPFANSHFINDTELGYIKYENGVPVQLNSHIFGHLLKTFDNVGERFTALLYEVFMQLVNPPDVEFFVNTQDFPILTKDGTKPNKIYRGAKYTDLVHDKFTPILSFCQTDPNIADILMPTSDDWLSDFAKHDGQTVYYPTEAASFSVPPLIPWEKRANKLIWRGSETGEGISSSGKFVNVRFAAHEASRRLNVPDEVDIGLIKKNPRPRLIDDGSQIWLADCVAPTHYADFMSQEEQFKCKYLMNIDGHTAAFRLNNFMLSGSLIVHMKTSEFKTWSSPIFIENVHYKSMYLSDKFLAAKRALDETDDENRQIAERARNLATKVLAKDTLLCYMSLLLHKMHSKIADVPVTQEAFESFTKSLINQKERYDRYMKSDKTAASKHVRPSARHSKK